MNYKERVIEANIDAKERYDLIMERVLQIRTEHTVKEEYWDYFRKIADYLKQIDQIIRQVTGGKIKTRSLEECEEMNWNLYYEILPGNYDRSYANPKQAVKVLGQELGPVLCFLYSELRTLIGFAFEGRLADITIYCELFVEIYNCFEAEEGTSEKEIKEIIYWFFSDYSEVFAEEKVGEMVDSSYDFFTNIVLHSDLTDLRYLYQYGEYITTGELNTAAFLNTLPEEEIQAMADTMSNGFIIGYKNMGKDLSKKKTICVEYAVGFERIIRAVMLNFKKINMDTTTYRCPTSSFFRSSSAKRGCYTKAVNPQYEYDHKNDRHFFMDKSSVERRIEVMKAAYDLYKKEAKTHAGPAVLEIFGEAPFAPVNKLESAKLTSEQNELNVYQMSKISELTNEYIPGEERSFTIIAYPIPSIGSNFEEIFRETVKINTLDYTTYQNMQQKIIDVLDQAKTVEIKGKGDNLTNLTVALYPLTNPLTETIFENCVADVNIPVGEVFTSPVLKGTNGLLHVTQVYLSDLKYENLKLEFKDGMIIDYSCTNFVSEEENKKFIYENLLNRHETLALGEFAIGTNTTAYKVAKKYKIADKLPILIAEKMGPHFAVGDTCYSHAEEVKLFNPDGKEIVARENEVSCLRKEDTSKAYFNCHTDITIPYDELDSITGITKDNQRLKIIVDGRFVVDGTMDLNLPLDELE